MKFGKSEGHKAWLPAASLALLALSWTSCAAEMDTETDDSDGISEGPISAELANAQTTEVGALPATVRLAFNKGFCTGTRIGTRTVLTAAHCVVNTTTGLAPASISLKIGSSDMSVSYTQVNSTVSVHPSYSRCWAREACPGISAFARNQASDLAVLQTDRDLPASIAIASIDARRVLPGEGIMLAGAGRIGDGTIDFKVRNAPSYRAVPASFGSSVAFAAGAENVSYLVPGSAYDEVLPNVRPGDSGGPSYRKSGNDWLVVGVNSTSSGNVFGTLVRLDDQTPNSIPTWLRGFGARIVRSAAPNLRTCAAGLHANLSLNVCVRNDNGIAPDTVLAQSLVPVCEADKAEPANDQSRRLSEVASCRQRGFPVTLLHRWTQKPIRR